MEKDKIAEQLKNVITLDKIKIDEPMSKHTTFKIGGSADILLLPETKDEIVNIFKFCNENNIPITIIGNGSNLLVRDKGIRGIVIKLFNNYAKIKVDGNTIEAESGALLSKIANEALKNNLSGLEFASGIPGTLGGAVIMNAGAYGGEMKEVITETTYVDENGQIKTITNLQHEFGYRKSIFQGKNCIILSTKMQLCTGEHDQIKMVMDDLNSKRKENQPLNFPSAGSTFKRPEGYFVGKLVQDCNLKGYEIGGAKVSEKHAGFVINAGNATCTDVLSLISHIQTTVKERFGVELETEIKVIGEE